MYFAHIFFQSVTHLFNIFTVSFKEQYSLMLMKSNLSFYSFKNYAFDVASKNFCLTKRYKDIPVCFLSQIL